jgi:major type 1 subunit fimbrin (pilin)
MKRPLITTVFMTGMMLFGKACASDGIIHFNGKVANSVCNVIPSTKVDMNDTSLDELTARGIGSHFNTTAFQVTLTSCPDTFVDARILFEGIADPNHPEVFQLDNSGQPGVAKGIGLVLGQGERLFRPGDTSDPISMGNMEDNYSLPFVATYKITDEPVIPGDANVSVQFSIIYN